MDCFSNCFGSRRSSTSSQNSENSPLLRERASQQPGRNSNPNSQRQPSTSRRGGPDIDLRNQPPEETRHGGFEKRAADKVQGVEGKRDKPSRIVNYGEATRQSTDKDFDAVLVDHKSFGPFMSGKKDMEGKPRNSLMEGGPYSTANPDCADPQVQDAISPWLKDKRSDDQKKNRKEDRVDVQFYDDKEPCPPCAHNIPEQAATENMNVDLFLAKEANEQEGKYKGAEYKRTYNKENNPSTGHLKSRGDNSTEQLNTKIDDRITKQSSEISKHQEQIKESENKIGEINSTEKDENKKKGQIKTQEKRKQQNNERISKTQQEIAQSENRKKEINSWTPIKN